MSTVETSSVVRSSLSCFPQCISVSCQRRTKRSTADLYSAGFGDFKGFGGTPLPKRPLSASLPRGGVPLIKVTDAEIKMSAFMGQNFCPLMEVSLK